MSVPKPIRVLECIRQGKIGGGESHLLSLVENLDRQAFEPIVLSFTDGPMIQRLNEMDVPTSIIHTERPFDITKWKEVKAFLHKENISLIHAHGTRANSNILWAARKLKIPVIYTIHGWSFHDDQNPVVKKLRVLGERYLTSKSDLNISVSGSNQETGKKYFAGFQSVVVNNGINLRRFSPQNKFKDIRKELAIGPEKTLLIFVARFTHQKQPLVLIRAFIEAVQQDPSLHLLLVGDGEQKAEALQLVKASANAEQITFSDSRQDVPDLLAASDIFVLPSLWEGLPIALLEAMSMGKAIIATKADGTREIMLHRNNGYLIDIEGLQKNLVAAILEVSRDKILREQMQLNAIETVKEKFNAVTMTRQIEDLYRQVLAN